jgi:hypothetical protein
MIQETVYKKRDNAIWLGLRVNQEFIDVSELTRVQLIIDDTTTYDSEVLGYGEAAPFDWESEEDVLILRLGGIGLAVGKHNALLIAFDADNENGVVWDEMRLLVRDR